MADKEEVVDLEMVSRSHMPGPWCRDADRVLGPKAAPPTPQHPETVVAQCSAFCGESGSGEMHPSTVYWNALAMSLVPELLIAIRTYHQLHDMLSAALESRSPTGKGMNEYKCRELADFLAGPCCDASAKLNEAVERNK